MHVMNPASLRAATSKILAVVQNDFPSNRALDALKALDDKTLMANKEPYQLLALLAAQLQPVGKKGQPLAKPGKHVAKVFAEKPKKAA